MSEATDFSALMKEEEKEREQAKRIAKGQEMEKKWADKEREQVKRMAEQEKEQAKFSEKENKKPSMEIAAAKRKIEEEKLIKEIFPFGDEEEESEKRKRSGKKRKGEETEKKGLLDLYKDTAAAASKAAKADMVKASVLIFSGRGIRTHFFARQAESDLRASPSPSSTKPTTRGPSNKSG